MHPLIGGFHYWKNFNLAKVNVFTNATNVIGQPIIPPASDFIITEAGDFIITEGGDFLITES